MEFGVYSKSPERQRKYMGCWGCVIRLAGVHLVSSIDQIYHTRHLRHTTVKIPIHSIIHFVLLRFESEMECLRRLFSLTSPVARSNQDNCLIISSLILLMGIIMLSRIML